MGRCIIVHVVRWCVKAVQVRSVQFPWLVAAEKCELLPALPAADAAWQGSNEQASNVLSVDHQQYNPKYNRMIMIHTGWEALRFLRSCAAPSP